MEQINEQIKYIQINEQIKYINSIVPELRFKIQRTENGGYSLKVAKRNKKDLDHIGSLQMTTSGQQNEW